MTSEFKRAVSQVLSDARIDEGAGADLIAVGIERGDCLEFLEDMLENSEPITPEWLAVLVQWSVATGVWIERNRWQSMSES